MEATHEAAYTDRTALHRLKAEPEAETSNARPERDRRRRGGVDIPARRPGSDGATGDPLGRRKPACDEPIDGEPDSGKRRNIPTAEFESVMRRGGQDRRSGSPTSGATATSTRSSSGAARTSRTGPTSSSHAPPLYIQEKVHPKVADRRPAARRAGARGEGASAAARPVRRLQRPARRARRATEFYPHDQHWSNRMILGDSLAGDGEPRRARGAARARCSASISTRPTASSSTRTSSGRPRRAT